VTGLYKHWTGNHYRVLFEAEWLDGSDPQPDQLLGVHAMVLHSFSEPVFRVWPYPHTARHKHSLLARWSGNTPCTWNEPCVVYIALYGDGRVSVRSVKEFTEIVNIDGKSVPRFVRVGD
jgi:hypothetical protein